ncbi:plant UBX domain-containing protein 1 isoform X1 [Cinnamomum micranthum f. kanehirae]|uniref:Plant UBX domain-containing protein 1 isoform X1 n=1 Tax=Cinnamomum micranthum f. kanehirae TaxID=337451 RepID=A0A443PWF3_9MAGN|nr:plant UBX domain-containing protein 1 isoform X1 [Cinnamomum micranthum f. kanehirae]
MVEGISVMRILSKRRILSAEPSIMADKTQAKIMAVAKELGREIHLFPTSATPSNKSLSALTSHSGESEDFYDFTKEDYYRVLKHRKEERFLKTCKLREAEEAERRSKITKAVIRVCFPNNYTLEAKFHPSETVQSLMDLLMKVVARLDLPFYIYTTPPKKQVKEMSKDFYSLGFAPGAKVYFSYDLPNVDSSIAYI